MTVTSPLLSVFALLLHAGALISCLPAQQTFRHRSEFEAAVASVGFAVENFDAFSNGEPVTTLMGGQVTFPSTSPTVFFGNWGSWGYDGYLWGGALIAEPRHQASPIVLEFAEPVFGVGASLYDDRDGIPYIAVISCTLHTANGGQLYVEEDVNEVDNVGFLGGTSPVGIVRAEFTIDCVGGNMELDGLVVSGPPPGDATIPTAHAGPDQAIHAGQIVQLDGSASFDDTTASTSLSYQWTMTLAPAGSGATLTSTSSTSTSFLADLPGDYRVQLQVLDEAGNISAPAEVVVSSWNVLPTADAGEPQAVLIGATVVLDGTASFDPDDDPLSYAWSIVEAPSGSASLIVDHTGAVTSISPDLPGRYVLALVVQDPFGASVAAEVEIVATATLDFVRARLFAARDLLLTLLDSELDAVGHRKSLQHMVNKVVTLIDAGGNTPALAHLDKLIERVDGVARRGQTDPKGLHEHTADFVLGSAQLAIYAELVLARDALQ